MQTKHRIDVGEPGITVDCNAWIQKAMRSNLKRASKNKVNAAGAKIAEALLKSCKPQSEGDAPEIAANSEKAITETRIPERIPEPTRRKRGRIRRIASAGTGRCRKTIRAFRKDRRAVLSGHGRADA